MESKGRRAMRAAPDAVPAETAKLPAPRPRAEEPGEAPVERSTSAETPAEAALPIATAATPAPLGAPPAARSMSGEELSDFGREVFAAFVQSQTAVARGLEALSAEAAGMAISGIDAAARAASEMLRVKTFSDAIEVNTSFTRNSFEALVGGSVKLSELGVKLATEASHPIFTQLGRSWIKAATCAF
jgi:hypothetical protein